jgi:hypothetical protein
LSCGGAFTGTSTGFAPGAAEISLPVELINPGRATGAATGRAMGCITTGRAGGCTTGAVSGLIWLIWCGSTAIAAWCTGRPEAMSSCFTTVTLVWLMYVTLVTLVMFT